MLCSVAQHQEFAESGQKQEYWLCGDSQRWVEDLQEHGERSF